MAIDKVSIRDLKDGRHTPGKRPETRFRTSNIAIEHLFSSYGMAESMAHRVSTSDDCAAANLQHHPWGDPATGKVRDESFPDLFFGALDQWADVAQTYVRGDERLLRAAMGGRNYNGMPAED